MNDDNVDTKLKAMQQFTSLLQYFKPKMASVEAKIDSKAPVQVTVVKWSKELEEHEGTEFRIPDNEREA